MINSYPEFEEQDYVPDGDIVRGSELFDNNCSGCHEQAGWVSAQPQGPNLRGFLGRQLGTADSKFEYSYAFKHRDFIWNKMNLNKFLFAPVTMVKGTNMKIWGIQNDQDRYDIIAYLYSRPEYKSKQLQVDQEYQENLKNFEDNRSKKKKRKRKSKSSSNDDVSFDDL